ncbi:hypothetical protein VCHENC02_0358B, partial [Vibrio harveyi]
TNMVFCRKATFDGLQVHPPAPKFTFLR